jgi:hypothetical protein
MKRRRRAAVAHPVVAAAMLAAFVVVGAQPAVAQLPVVCHGAPYVYSTVTVYKAHTDSIECHTVYKHTDHLVDRANQGLSPSLSGFSCGTEHEHSRVHVHCTNLEHSHHRFAVSWIAHPPTICPAAASTPASSIFTRTRAV